MRSNDFLLVITVLRLYSFMLSLAMKQSGVDIVSSHWYDTCHHVCVWYGQGQTRSTWVVRRVCSGTVRSSDQTTSCVA